LGLAGSVQYTKSAKLLRAAPARGCGIFFIQAHCSSGPSCLEGLGALGLKMKNLAFPICDKGISCSLLLRGAAEQTERSLDSNLY
jgi:hypothetical protein